MELFKLNKAHLETIMYDIMCDLKEHDAKLADKYQQIIDKELYHIDDTEAHEIVSKFKPFGEVYSMDFVKDLLARYNITSDCIPYYLCMNMMYNDYKSYIDNKRLDPKEFCFEMSKLFIHDADAKPYKVAKYFKMS